MDRAGIKSQRELARKLSTDGSLVGKWLNGKVLRIVDRRHIRALARILKTDADYFDDPPLPDRLAKLEAEAVRTQDLAPILRVLGLLANGNRREALRVYSEEVAP